ncbi:hypothetical protein Bca4012_072651 [Brassica carinata]|uniref:Uncharacterized protein n=1 Tax=Brassica napus TaxID=3708 RepID=A0ABQ7ZGP5_BRANA|nr:hypothetical protein HID58_066787 [Brassica napus]
MVIKGCRRGDGDVGRVQEAKKNMEQAERAQDPKEWRHEYTLANTRTLRTSARSSLLICSSGLVACVVCRVSRNRWVQLKT